MLIRLIRVSVRKSHLGTNPIIEYKDSEMFIHPEDIERIVEYGEGLSRLYYKLQHSEIVRGTPSQIAELVNRAHP